MELLYFNATPNLQNIAITWATASELENDYFILEHSGDGETWDEIGKIRGQGTTFTKHEYTFTDDFPIRGMQYYRLWQYDYNGDNELLDIALADHTGTEQFRIDLWPNPLSQRKLNIKTKNTSLIQNINVITSLGLRVEVPLKTLSSTEGYIELPLAADLYIIEIETNKGIIRRKIIKR